VTRSSAKLKIASKSALESSTQRDEVAFVETLKRQWLETIDALPDPFITVSDNYVIGRANHAMAEISGVDVKKLGGKLCYKVFAGRDTPCENCKMRDARGNESIPRYEIHNALNDRWYEVATRRLSPSEADSAVVQIYRDRTEAKNLQRQVAQSEKLASIGQLAGGFAHEINNPLGGILVFSQMLLREMDKKSQHYQDVVEIEAAAKRCKTIVENLLDYARQRPLKPNLSHCDLHTVIPNAVKFAALGHNAGNRCEINLKLEAKHHEITSDQNRLTQIILNLCSNALQAMPDGGTLDVSTTNIGKDNGKQIIIKVADSGSGISPKNLSKIFEPFFTTKEPGQGTGLGLSIVYGMIQDLGGSIDVQSRVGHGSVFSITLPVHKEAKPRKN
jgi:two-component system NtrC family sensor kinase